MLRSTSSKFASLISPHSQKFLSSDITSSVISHNRIVFHLSSLLSFSTSAVDTSLFSARARSLAYERGHDKHEKEATENPGAVRKLFLTLGGYYSKESMFMRASKGLYECITEQASASGLLKELDIPQDFQHQHAMLCLHVWLVLVRLRAEGRDGKQLAQIMYDTFQDDVEHRVRKAGVKVRVSKQLTELEKQFYGSCMAYDKAMTQDDSLPKESLSSALLRNVYQGDPTKKNAASRLEKYVQLQLACLSMTESADVMSGNIKF